MIRPTELGSDFMGAVVSAESGTITVGINSKNAEYAYVFGQLVEGAKVAGEYVVGGDDVKRATTIELAL